MTTSAISLILIIGGGFWLLGSNSFWTSGRIYLVHIIAALYFLGILVSHQAVPEDIFSRVERSVSAFLFSFIFFGQLIYAPLARYLFGTLIQQKIFLADLLALAFFLLAFFLLGTTALVINSFARFGWLSRLSYFNNESAFYILRSLWPAIILLLAYLYLLRPFLIITV